MCVRVLLFSFLLFFKFRGRVWGVQVIYFSDISALLLCTPALQNALP